MNAQIFKKSWPWLLVLPLMVFVYHGVIIYRYSFRFAEGPADVAIVLGAGSHAGKVSPVFRERINHGIHLWKEGKVGALILTGGLGKGERISDSRAAKAYARSQGMPEEAILLEEKSTITFENLKEARLIMDKNGWKTALLVSDPIHMKRSMRMCKKIDIQAASSPTPSSMYRSTRTKFNFLLYESWYYTLGFFKWGY